MEVVLCGLGLITLTPLLLIIALLIKVTSPGPVLFRQKRLGQHGRTFELLKFRSMVDRAQAKGPLVTAGGDRRVTPVGRVLRVTKLDELPQLWNVVRGDMALVGPRPEVPAYVGQYPRLFGLVLQQRPGITDVCTLHLRNEEQILAVQDDPETYYVQKLLPRKLAASIREGWRRTWWRDLRVIVGTVVPGCSALAPPADFRPLASLYSLNGEGLAAELAAGEGEAPAVAAEAEALEIELGA
jgi:lipopolysaccharide/colanic/teichoic acid biosynthesis glycosyltransferase